MSSGIAFFWQENYGHGWQPVAGPQAPTVKHGRIYTPGGGSGPQARGVKAVALEHRFHNLDGLMELYGEVQ